MEVTTTKTTAAPATITLTVVVATTLPIAGRSKRDWYTGNGGKSEIDVNKQQLL